MLVVAVVVALIGAGLVFLYAAGADERASAKTSTRQVVTAIGQILPGESFEEATSQGKIQVVPVPVDEVLEGSASDGRDFEGKIAVTTIYPGEQLLAQRFTDDLADVESAVTLEIPQGMQGVALTLDDEERVGNFTRPGSRVAVYVSGVPGVDGALFTEVLVIGVGSTTLAEQPGLDANGNPLAATPSTVITLALSPKDADRLITARDSGAKVRLTLLPATSTGGSG